MTRNKTVQKNAIPRKTNRPAPPFIFLLLDCRVVLGSGLSRVPLVKKTSPKKNQKKEISCRLIFGAAALRQVYNG
jgi:hypothetical protein